MVAPLVVIQKPNGKISMCIDYRKLNQITDRPIFKIPDSRYLFDQSFLNSNNVCCAFELVKLMPNETINVRVLNLNSHDVKQFSGSKNSIFYKKWSL